MPALALALIFGGARPASAHGVIERAEPPVGGSVSQPPSAVQIWFTETPDPRLSSIAVYGPTGPTESGPADRVDAGDVRLEADGSLRVSLRPGLLPGTYAVAWRIFTAGDGHTTSGVYAFGVGAPVDLAASTAAARSPLADGARFLSLAGGSIFMGVAVFRWAIRLEDEERFRRSLVWAVQSTRAALGLGALGSLYAQVGNTGAPLLEVLATRWGVLWLARAAVIVLVAIWADALLRGAKWDREPRFRRAAVVAGGLLLLTTSLSSHSAARAGLWGVAVDWLHLVAAAIWAGGVVCAAIAIRQGESAFLADFSILATAAAGGLLASGAWLSAGQVGSWSGLLLTAYGRMLLIKLAAVFVAFGLGAANALRRNRTLPPLEAAAGLVVVLAAAILTNLPPAYAQPTEGAPTRLEFRRTMADLEATVALSPARIGVNMAEVRLVGAQGRPITGAHVELHFLPVDGWGVANEMPLAEIGNGVYSGSGANITSPGEWQMLLQVDEGSFLNFDYAVGPDGAARARGQPLPVEVRLVGWLHQYAPAAAAVGLLAAAAGWSWLAWRSLRLRPPTRLAAAMWLVPGLLLAGAFWLWYWLNF